LNSEEQCWSFDFGGGFKFDFGWSSTSALLGR
jgi:hypothetical protein